jgi:hypothetical protein
MNSNLTTFELENSIIQIDFEISIVVPMWLLVHPRSIFAKFVETNKRHNKA